MIYTILVIVQVAVALGLIALILLQHGKGADAGAAFGSGASGTVFGAKGAANFMSRATAALATVFMLTSLALAYLVNGASVGGTGGSITDRLSQGSNGTPTSVIEKQTAHKGGAHPKGPQPQGGSSSGGGNANQAGNANKPDNANKNNGPRIPD